MSAERFVVQWVDGSRQSADELRDWHDANSQPKIAERPLLDGPRPVRWIRDTTLSTQSPTGAFVEIQGGDRLPGTVLEYRSGHESPFDLWPAHLLVEPNLAVEWPDPRSRQAVEVLTAWLRRVVWEPRGSDRYEPATLFLRDGRRLSFRSVRWQTEAVRVLLDDGTADVPFSQIAELHLPRRDPWEAYYQQVALLAPLRSTRLIQVATTDGLSATASLERYTARNNGSHPDHWYHAVQPAWTLRPLWVRHRTIAWRRFFAPHEVPLSLLEPAEARQRVLLAGARSWQSNQNVLGQELRSGGKLHGWGWGVQAYLALRFELPTSARRFQASVGLDEAAGKGGCARALLFGDLDQAPLYQSSLLIGSDQVQSTGPIELQNLPPSATPGNDPTTKVANPRNSGSQNSAVKNGPTNQPAPDPPASSRRSLWLVADDAHTDRPPGTDPLDIRDLVDWLEPLVELDPAALVEELDHRRPRLITAWQGWTVSTGQPDRGQTTNSPVVPAVRLVNRWDDFDPRRQRYRTLVRPTGTEFTLSQQVAVGPAPQMLLVTAHTLGRAAGKCQLQVRADGQLLAELEIPSRDGPTRLDPLAVSLDSLAQREVRLEITQRTAPGDQADGTGEVSWQGLTLSDHWPGLYQLFEDHAQFAQQLDPQGDSVQIERLDRYRGTAAVRIQPVVGSDPHRLELPELKIRESPRLGEFRYLRFAWKKRSSGRICLSLGHDQNWGPIEVEQTRRFSFRYDAGIGTPSYGAAVRVAGLSLDEWQVVTRDLYADFGEFTLTGLSLSAPDGGAALFDHLYLARSPGDWERLPTDSAAK